MNNLMGNMVIGSFAAMSMAMIDVSDNNLTRVIPEVFGRLENTS